MTFGRGWVSATVKAMSTVNRLISWGAESRLIYDKNGRQNLG
jgi:hypothetical protein